MKQLDYAARCRETPCTLSLGQPEAAAIKDPAARDACEQLRRRIFRGEDLTSDATRI